MDTEHMPSADRLRDLLVGRKITGARIADENPGRHQSGPVGYLTLSDGTMLKVWGNDGGCACNAGCYPLAELNEVDNVITNVEVEECPDHDYPSVECRTCGETRCYDPDHDNQGYYRIFVFAENRRINVASFEGTDGNGYYGTGWWLQATHDPTQGDDRG